MESVLLTAVIEARECQAVYMADIPGAFMQGDQDEVIHMVLYGTLVTMLIECICTVLPPRKRTTSVVCPTYERLIQVSSSHNSILEEINAPIGNVGFCHQSF